MTSPDTLTVRWTGISGDEDEYNPAHTQNSFIDVLWRRYSGFLISVLSPELNNLPSGLSKAVSSEVAVDPVSV